MLFKREFNLLISVLSLIILAVVFFGIAGVKNVARASDGIVAQYSFDDPTNIGKDDSGLGNNAVPTGNIASVAGKVGNAASFSGSSYLITTDPVIGASEATVCAWVNIRDYGGFGRARIIDNGETLLYLAQGYFIFSNDGNTDALAAPGSVALNAWTHVCGTRDTNGTSNLYVNGNASGAPNQPGGKPAIGTTSLYIGNRQQGDRGFDGMIDDLRIYNRVLTQSEIQQLAGTVPANASSQSAISNYTYALPTPSSYFLSVYDVGTGSGKIIGGPIDCGSTCQVSVNSNTVVTLSEIPDANSEFKRWKGDCSGNFPSCAVTLTSNLSVSAEFVPANAHLLEGDGTSSAVQANRDQIENSNPLATSVLVKTTGKLNIRKKPGLKSKVLKQVSAGIPALILDGPTVANAFEWWQVEFDDGMKGWVSAKRLSPLKPIASNL